MVITNIDSSLLAELNILFDQPWTRISPYIIGIGVGHYLCKIQNDIRMGLLRAISGKTMWSIQNHRIM